MYRDETIELMEPMLPVATRAIEDLIFTLIQQASELNAVLTPRTAEAVGEVLRSKLEARSLPQGERRVIHGGSNKSINHSA